MIKKYKELTPIVPKSCYIFDTAVIIGNVEIDENCIVYPGVVIRGEKEKVTIGHNTNIQENTCIHIENGHDVHIGSNVTIGHNSIVHACTISDNCLIGMGAIIQDGAVVGEDCYIGAGAVVPRNMIIPKGHLAYGIPAKVIRPITQAEYDDIRISAEEYQGYRKEFKNQEEE